MSIFYLVVLLIYSFLLIGIGLWLGRRVRGTSDFFVAGRKLGPTLIFSTMLAANIGAGSTVAAAGLGYSDGLSAWWWVGSAALGSIVLAFWIGPRMRQLANSHHFQTLGDYLDFRFGKGVRGTITVLMSVGTISLLAVQLIGIGFVLNVITGLERWAGSIIGGFVVIGYFSVGGLFASAWINLIQLVILLLGFVIALPLALNSTGGFAQIYEATQHIDEFWNPLQGGNSGWFYLISPGLAFIISPGLIQKVYGARDDRAVRLGVALNGLVLLVFAAVPMLFGVIARATYPSLLNPELALPNLLIETVPPIVGALGLAALFSAEVSSSDAILFMFSTSLAKDLYGRFINPNASDREILAFARKAAVLGGVLGTGLAVLSVSMISMLSIFYSLLVVSLSIPILIGLYTQRLGTTEAYASIITGVGLYIVVHFISQGSRIFGLTPQFIGVLGAATGCYATWLVRSRVRFH